MAVLPRNTTLRMLNGVVFSSGMNLRHRKLLKVQGINEWGVMRIDHFLKRDFRANSDALPTFKCQIIVADAPFCNNEVIGNRRTTCLVMPKSNSDIKKLVLCRSFSEKAERVELKDVKVDEKDEKGPMVEESGVKEKARSGPYVRFKGMVNTFWIGCKQLLWIDARKAWATKRKLKRHDYDLTIVTREELRHMRQVQVKSRCLNYCQN